LSKNKKTVDKAVVRPKSEKMASQIALCWTFHKKRAEVTLAEPCWRQIKTFARGSFVT
jgi:hypothetical protein